MRIAKRAIITIYRDRRLNWRWRMQDYRNRKTIGASTECYAQLIRCRQNLERVLGIVAPGVDAGKATARRVVWVGPRAWGEVGDKR